MTALRYGCRGTSIRIYRSLLAEQTWEGRSDTPKAFAFGKVKVRFLPAQPAIPAFSSASRERGEKALNCRFSRIRFRLHTLTSPALRPKGPKVSNHFREYSRFAETFFGDLVRTRLPPGPYGALLGNEPRTSFPHVYPLRHVKKLSGCDRMGNGGQSDAMWAAQRQRVETGRRLSRTQAAR
jgi:hypothetical protein